MREGALINTLGPSLRRRYPYGLRRVMLDLGLTCPNRDGSSGYGGCIYCDLSGSGTGAARGGADLDAQVEAGLARVRRSIPEGPCAILYFQSYSNTYPDLQPLADALEQMAKWAEVAPVLAVGTRPDCFSEEAAELLAAQKEHFREVWVEFGLETADDAVQARIGRHDTLANFHAACALAGRHGLTRIAHCICGLPGDAPDTLERQVEEIVRAGCEGVKFHQLMVLRRTKLAHEWLNGDIELLAPETYAARVADALERLPAEVVVHRLVADAPGEELLAPRDWPAKGRVLALIEAELRARGSRQGARDEATVR
jgi:radical SAM protein (TIGR01212 family)